MEKLLHERLRGADSWYQLFNPIEVTGASFRVLFNKLADEIERCYIPRPRFEDGEPVQFGDRVLSNYGEDVEATTLGAGIAGNLYVNPYAAEDEGVLTLKSGRYAKRPQPKVLDADGIEIKVGDTVYYTVSGEKRIVERIEKDEVCFTTGLYGTPDNLTHKEPVLDADGVRIKVGDTVYALSTGEELFVEEVLENGQIRDARRILFDSEDITHKEPDSLEKLRDDMLNEFANLGRYELKGYANRLSALIERGA